MSLRGAEKRVKRHQCQRSAPCAKGNCGRTGKKSLQMGGVSRKSRKRPTLVVGMKSNGKFQMKISHQILAITASLLSSQTISHAQFSGFNSGDLVVLQDGTGSAGLTSAGTALYLDQYTTSGSFVNDLAIPSTAGDSGNELVNSGTAASEGQLSLSANDQYLVFAGYNVAAGTTGVSSSTSSADPRGIVTVDATGNYTLTATTTTFYSANNIRGGTSDGKGNIWGAGPGGTVYLGSGTAAQISSVNSLAVQDIGGNLFYSTAKGTTGIYKISGTPASGTATPTLLIGNANPSDFTFNANMTIAYVANTGSGANGGISRYNFNGTSWTLAYTLDSNTAMNGVVANFSGTDPIIYATTESGTSLVEITDAGVGTTSGATVLDTAGSNEAFRGLEFAPESVPEPATCALVGLGLMTLLSINRHHNRKS